jgi:hypothetical protein
MDRAAPEGERRRSPRLRRRLTLLARLLFTLALAIASVASVISSLQCSHAAGHAPGGVTRAR